MGEVVVKASRRVRKGEELVFKYVGQLEGREGRRRELEEHWHFLCRCEVCSLPEEESRENDRRRRVITSFLTEGMEEMGEGQDRRMVRGLEALALCYSIKEEARQEVVSLLTTLSQLCVLAEGSLATLDLRALRQLEAALGGCLEDPHTYRVAAAREAACISEGLRQTVESHLELVNPK